MIVVTGGAGFIGSNLVHALNNQGVSDLIVVDHLDDPIKAQNLKGARYREIIEKTKFISKIDQFRDKITAILHQGACSDTTETDLDYLRINNFEYSISVFNFCQSQGIPLIYASSAAVYGHGENGFIETPTCENPLNGYARSKLDFDNFLRPLIADRMLNAPVVGLRYFNVYGPNEGHKGKMASVAFHLFNQAKNEGVMRLFEGSANFKRDFVFVDDVVTVALHFLKNPATGIYNCGTGTALSFTDVAQALQTHMPNTDLTEVPFPDHLKGKYQAFTCADLTALRNAGCQHQFISLSEGIGRYFGFLSAH